MSKDNGGPAFPFEGGDNNGMQPCYGMTLRDYFAAKALSTIAAFTADDVNTWSAEDFAKHAYTVADAMLAERDKE